MSDISIRANNGSRCQNERHLFRIGTRTETAIEFEASEDNFQERLLDAMIDHGAFQSSLYIQVFTTEAAGWRNVQNPRSGGIMAVTPDIAQPGSAETCNRLFMWACNSVQMARDIDVLASGLSESDDE